MQTWICRIQKDDSIHQGFSQVVFIGILECSFRTCKASFDFFYMYLHLKREIGKKKPIGHGVDLWSSQFLASCSTWPETYVSAGINWAGAAGKFFVVGVLFIYSCHFLQVSSLWFIFWREIKFRHIGHIDLSFSNLCQKNPKESWLRILVFNSYLKHKIVIHYILHTHRFFRLTG